ncbi:cadherin-related family member 5 [Lepisosteus oculatus]|uniref:cadherin-related family member 5 n=1 Tax=Lepisosteus oculatus TaxID=7918 RepID=UPI0035F50AE8
MDLKYKRFSVNGILFLLLLFFLHRECDCQICSLPVPVPIQIEENNAIDQEVVNITTSAGVKLTISEDKSQAFALHDKTLVLTKQMDYENMAEKVIIASIRCEKEAETVVFLHIFVEITNVNEYPPYFQELSYTLSVDEFQPVNTNIGRVNAEDRDGDRLYYHLDNSTSGAQYFHLASVTAPDILVSKILDYDSTPKLDLILFVRDTENAGAANSHTASTNIAIDVKDIDNRPPWFLPCKEISFDDTRTKICLNMGYKGSVNLTVKEEGVLPLKPEPLYAIDGDKGINEPIEYYILSGNEAGLFDMNSNTGNITMLKAVDIAGPILLTVMAFQTKNPNQFSTTSVVIDVVMKTLNPPEFEKPRYNGFISSDSDVGSMVLEEGFSARPLKVLATDADFADGVNPNVEYKVQDNNDLTVTKEGFILTKKILQPNTIIAQIIAEDMSNGESASTIVTVEVLMGATTAMPTTNATTDLFNSTTALPTSEPTQTPDATYGSSPWSPSPSSLLPTSGPHTGATTAMPTTNTTTDLFNSTTALPTSEPTQTPDATYGSSPWSPSPSSLLPTSGPHTGGDAVLTGAYSPEDMAALGATLAVLLILSMVIIGLLVFKIYKTKTDWKKLSEASIFRSSIGRGSSANDGMQFVNDGYKNGDDASSVDSKCPDEVDHNIYVNLQSKTQELPEPVSFSAAPALASDLLGDSSSLAGSDKTESEKEVKPILTKERRNEEGYKSVWFKEDIDPNAKEEVVIIPDNPETEAVEDYESLAGDDSDKDPESPTPQRKASLEDAEIKFTKTSAVRFQDPKPHSGDKYKLDTDNEEDNISL